MHSALVSVSNENVCPEKSPPFPPKQSRATPAPQAQDSSIEERPGQGNEAGTGKGAQASKCVNLLGLPAI